MSYDALGSFQSRNGTIVTRLRRLSAQVSNEPKGHNMFRLTKMAAATVCALILFVPASVAAQPAAESDCAALTAMRIPDLRIVRAQMITPDPVWRGPGLSAAEESRVEVRAPLCRVEGTIEGEIGFELWLPAAGTWNRRMLGVGNGGFAGFIRYDGLAFGVNQGFATVSTDTGHKSSERNWAISAPRRLENYGHRGHHLTAAMAKHIIATYYGLAASYNYFIGCSGGGMQAMNLAQRYPADYDGIIAGSHGTSIVGIAARWLSGILVDQDPATRVTARDWRHIADTAIRQCDRLDGVADGILNNPNECKFDLRTTPGLTAAQLDAAARIYGPVVGRDGTKLFAGYHPGVAFTPLSSVNMAAEVFAHWYYQDPNWDYTRFDPARDLPLVEDAVPGASATNPNLTAFMRRGGKIISQHGLTDPIVPAQATTDYYNSVARFMGQDQTESFYKLYLPSGVDHCEGGVGPDNFGTIFHQPVPVPGPRHDMLAALIDWVEQGRAPSTIIASKIVDQKVTMTRPICPYPQIVRYLGRGDTNDARNFTCARP